MAQKKFKYEASPNAAKKLYMELGRTWHSSPEVQNLLEALREYVRGE